MASLNSPASAPQRRFDSEIEVEQLTGISRRTLQKWRLIGAGPRYYKVEGCVRYDLDEVIQWMQSGVVEPKEEAA